MMGVFVKLNVMLQPVSDVESVFYVSDNCSAPVARSLCKTHNDVSLMGPVTVIPVRPRRSAS